MSWEERAPVKQVLLFCEVWRTCAEIRERFKLSPVEAWHCFRFIAKLRRDVKVEDRKGKTGRAYMVMTRPHVLQELQQHV